MHQTANTAENRLLDQHGRIHTNLRLSVTDRCNLRCFYCMPAENVVFCDRKKLLRFEEIVRFVQVAASLGVNKLRLTGGEPLVRSNLPALIKQLAAIPGISDIALTTNGILLADQAAALRDAGLDRLNVSLDSLSEDTFQHISRRTGLQKVLDGLFAARKVGFDNIRLNAIAIRGLTENEIVPLAEFSREHHFEIRFIEFMPLDADGNWQPEKVLTGQSIRETLEAAFGKLEPAERKDPSQPAIDFRFVDGIGGIGFINPVSQPFCGNCNRLRLTAEGQIHNCLFSTTAWDARAVLRNSGTGADTDTSTDTKLRQLLLDSVAGKQLAHTIGESGFEKPSHAMFQIGG